MWSFEHTEQTTATPEQLWAYYVDAPIAPLWDPLVAEIRRHGPFATGSTGTNKPPHGPRVKSRLTEVVPHTSSASRVPYLFSAGIFWARAGMWAREHFYT